MDSLISDLRTQLRSFQVPVSTSSARRVLGQMQSMINYLVVFQHFFPAEYAESMEQVRRKETPLLPPPGHAYSPHEVRLLKLIDDQLFPLPLWEEVEGWKAEDRYLTIPIEPFGIDLCCGEDLLEMDFGWQLMYYLVGDLEAEIVEGAFEDERKAIFALPIENGKVDDASLREVCERESEPLSFFRHVIDLMANDTGLVWLDATVEMPCTTADWSVETMEELRVQYRAALVLQEKTSRFVNWLEGDLVPRFAEVIRVWNQSVLETRKKSHQE